MKFYESTRINDWQLGYALFAAVILFLPAANADVIYNYTGNDFNYLYALNSPPNAPNPLTSSNFITIQLALATPLADNLDPFQNDVSNWVGIQPISWTISDGIHTITSDDPLSNFYFSTDSSGNIIDWSIYVSQNNTCVYGAWCIGSYNLPASATGDAARIQDVSETEIYYDGPVYLGEVVNSPGIWTESGGPSSAPEPETLLLCGFGVVGVAAWRWRSSGRASGA